MLALARLRQVQFEGHRDKLRAASREVRRACARTLPLVGIPVQTASDAAGVCALACGDTGAVEDMAALVGVVDRRFVDAVIGVVGKLASSTAAEPIHGTPRPITVHHRPGLILVALRSGRWRRRRGQRGRLRPRRCSQGGVRSKRGR